MAIIIDGYNLLHAANIVAEGPGKYTLEKSRRSVLKAVAALLSPKERNQTTVVFDGKDAPPGLGKVADFAGMKVMFSAPGTEADDLIESLIRSNTVPRRLTVVSGDHRLHRAARRRQATAIDSDVWYRRRSQERRLRRASDVSLNSGENVGGDIERLSQEEVADWLNEFGDLEINEADLGGSRLDEGGRRRSGTNSRLQSDSEEGVFNPFPEGYGEDLLDD